MQEIHACISLEHLVFISDAFSAYLNILQTRKAYCHPAISRKRGPMLSTFVTQSNSSPIINCLTSLDNLVTDPIFSLFWSRAITIHDRLALLVPQSAAVEFDEMAKTSYTVWLKIFSSFPIHPVQSFTLQWLVHGFHGKSPKWTGSPRRLLFYKLPTETKKKAFPNNSPYN